MFRDIFQEIEFKDFFDYCIANEIEEYYLKDAKGCFAPNDNNLVIFIVDDKNTFVIPRVNQKYGVACLNQQNVLLGSF